MTTRTRPPRFELRHPSTQTAMGPDDCSYTSHRDCLREEGQCPGCAQVDPTHFLALLPGDWITGFVENQYSSVLVVGALFYIGIPHLYVLDPEEPAPRPANMSDCGVVEEARTTDASLYRRLDRLRGMSLRRRLHTFQDLAVWIERDAYTYRYGPRAGAMDTR